MAASPLAGSSPLGDEVLDGKQHVRRGWVAGLVIPPTSGRRPVKTVGSDDGQFMRFFWNRERRQNASLLVTTSWDDGHPADLRVADLLDKHGLKGTFFIPCSNSEGRSVMCSSDVAELGRRFEIGGHTQNHVSLTEIAPRAAAN